MGYAIVGTAGHVDHGKTELTRALTGVQTDRLKEEHERGISIKLGFAPLELPNGQHVGLVDVPGHEKFIKQMLAGAAGMDVVLLIIAADEGVMPQTREHLDILRLLDIKNVIVVFTKVDLVDEEWLELVRDDTADFLENAGLSHAPVVEVSAYTGKGIEELKNILMESIEKSQGKQEVGKPRLPVDRVFTITGFGTVVTGTLWSGRVNRGDVLSIMPRGQKTRVRNIQVHGENVETAYAGQRVALNITDVETGDVPHGSVLVPEGVLKTSYRLDMELKLLPDKAALPHRQRVRVHVGTSEVIGRVYLLDREQLEPGESALVQIRMEQPLVAARKDRAVLRIYSPMVTVGGGYILDPVPPKHQRFDKQVIEDLKTRLAGEPSDLILQVLEGTYAAEAKEIQQKAGLTEEETTNWLRIMQENEELVKVASHYISTEGFARRRQQVISHLELFHEEYPLRRGAFREEIRSRYFADVPAKFFIAFIGLLNEQNYLDTEGSFVFLKGFQPEPTQKQEKEIEEMHRKFREGEMMPPDPADLIKSGGKEASEYYQYLLGQQKLIKITEQIVVDVQVYQTAVCKIAKHLEKHGELKLSDVRDLLGSSRKYVLPLLEELDRQNITRRVEDKRVPGSRMGEACRNK